MPTIVVIALVKALHRTAESDQSKLRGSLPVRPDHLLPRDGGIASAFTGADRKICSAILPINIRATAALP